MVLLQDEVERRDERNRILWQVFLSVVAIGIALWSFTFNQLVFTEEPIGGRRLGGPEFWVVVMALGSTVFLAFLRPLVNALFNSVDSIRPHRGSTIAPGLLWAARQWKGRVWKPGRNSPTSAALISVGLLFLWLASSVGKDADPLMWALLVGLVVLSFISALVNHLAVVVPAKADASEPKHVEVGRRLLIKFLSLSLQADHPRRGWGGIRHSWGRLAIRSLVVYLRLQALATSVARRTLFAVSRVVLIGAVVTLVILLSETFAAGAAARSEVGPAVLAVAFLLASWEMWSRLTGDPTRALLKELHDEVLLGRMSEARSERLFDAIEVIRREGISIQPDLDTLEEMTREGSEPQWVRTLRGTIAPLDQADN